MVQLTHGGENIQKMGDILKAAQKRFGLFGLEKTTMNEIAADLNMSKGAIYYYFPDKEQLYKAVVNKEHNEFLQKVKERMSEMTDPAEMLKEYVQINLEFFRTLLNLSRTRLNEMTGLNPFMKEIVTEHRLKEQQLLIDIFTDGTRRGKFTFHNHEEVAILFLDLMRGLRRIVIGKKDIFYLEEEEYKELVRKVGLFTEIFTNGLTCNLRN